MTCIWTWVIQTAYLFNVLNYIYVNFLPCSFKISRIENHILVIYAFIWLSKIIYVRWLLTYAWNHFLKMWLLFHKLDIFGREIKTAWLMLNFVSIISMDNFYLSNCIKLFKGSLLKVPKLVKCTSCNYHFFLYRTQILNHTNFRFFMFHSNKLKDWLSCLYVFTKISC